MFTTAAADNGVGCNVTAAAEDIGWTWLGQGGSQRITSPLTVAHDLQERRVAQR